MGGLFQHTASLSICLGSREWACNCQGTLPWLSFAGAEVRSSSSAPEPTPSLGINADGTSGPLPASSSEQAAPSTGLGPAPSTPSVSEDPTPSAPPSPSFPAPPGPTPTAGREVVVVRVRLMLVSLALTQSDLDSLQEPLGRAVERLLLPVTEDVELFSFSSCGQPACFQLDFAIATTDVHSLDLRNGTEVCGAFSLSHTHTHTHAHTVLRYTRWRGSGQLDCSCLCPIVVDMSTALPTFLPCGLS